MKFGHKIFKISFDFAELYGRMYEGFVVMIFGDDFKKDTENGRKEEGQESCQ